MDYFLAYLKKVDDTDDYAWTEWGQCSATCGESVRRRERVCVHGELNVDPECSDVYKNNTRIKIYEDEACDTLPCRKKSKSIVEKQ